MTEEEIKYIDHSEEGNDEINIKSLLYSYLRYWHWILLGILFGLSIAYLVNRLSTKSYKASAKVLMLDKGGEIELPSIAALNRGGLWAGKMLNLENEKAKFTSRRMIDSVVTSLELQNTYYQKGRIRVKELWGNELPFKIVWRGDSLPAGNSPTFSIEFDPVPNYILSMEDGTEPVRAQMGDTLDYMGFRFSLVWNNNFSGDFNRFKRGHYLFNYGTGEQKINNILSRLEIEPTSKTGHVVKISIAGPNRAKNEAIVDSLISKFNQDDVGDKRLAAKKAERFLANRLEILYQELDSVEGGLVNFMRSSGMVSVESAAQKFIEKETQAEKDHFEYQIQKQLTENFRDELMAGEEYQMLPNFFGIKNQTINGLTHEYNQAVVELNHRLISSTLENPKAKQLTVQLDILKGNLLISINGYLRDLEASLNRLEERETGSSTELSKIPEQTKKVRSIERQQKIKEELYVYLLQQHEQAALTYATTESNMKILERAYTPKTPIGLNSKLLYIAGFILGFIIPIGIIYLKYLFYTKIDTQGDVERLIPNVTVLAEIPDYSNRKQEDRLITPNDRSPLAEAFRVLRTNLSFYTGEDDGQGKLIFVTSSIKGEGKTFIALNTAHSLAAGGHKTLIIGCDLRNPQTHKYYGRNKNSIGVTNYLVDKSLKLKDLLNTGDKYFSNLDLVIAGQIPPNPAELLMNGRFEQLLAEAKEQYDYVIVDTAPTLPVTDTLLISKYSELTLYVVKSGYTDSSLAHHIQKLRATKKIGTMGIVVNGLKERVGYGYGYSYNYGYGYGYGAEFDVPKWWEFWKKRD